MQINVNDIGALTYFRGSNVWILPQDLRAALDDNGFSEVDVIDLTKVPVSRAVRSADHFRTPDVRVDVIAVDGVAGKRVSSLATFVDFGLLNRVQVSDAEVRWEQFDSVRFDRTTGWTGGQTETAAQFVETGKRWQTQVDYATVRKLTLDLLDGVGAFSVGGSGVFYVHGPQMARFSAIRAMVARVPGAKLHAIRVDPADAESVAAVGDAAKESMAERVAEVIARLGEWRERARGRKSTLEHLLVDLQAVRDEAAGLCGALRFSTSEIEAAVAAAAGEVQAALDGATDPTIFAAPEQTEQAPVVAPPADAAPAPAPAPSEVAAALQEPAPAPVTIPEDLDAVDSFSLRKLARVAGITGWATKSRPILLDDLRALRAAA